MKHRSKLMHPLLAGLLALSLVACSSVDLGQGTGDTGANAGAASNSGSAGGAQSQGNATDTVKGVDLQAATEASSAQQATANLAKLIYFDYDSFALKDEFAPVIAGYARALVADRTTRLLLAGHTDERGSREYNLALGQQRAEAVKRALLLLGAQELQVEAISYGEEKPASLGADEASFAQNRRVEITVR